MTEPSNTVPPHYAMLTFAVNPSVSSPHHFLKERGQQAEMLRTREWIVGRVTSITERVVEPNVCKADINSRTVTVIVRWHL